ncbi:alpha/beta fold hydrolase [Candidatus Mycoplasma mahonii]|uniref:alpha/beta fold hydrolase n=1 Tax=Candidatus Mycoplasma mahonii TaxID=3004105 RepID=UPI0026EAA9FA|nr:alpha/beta hydrolase [Candidatus Mycoplasma mahonii]WKX02693.1 alpha/beta hydrolase [Candidatus Mycoplasma mahonii]
MKQIKINNTWIKYLEKDNNSKITLLCIHGYDSSSDTFDQLYDIENNFNIISINIPGNKYSKHVDMNMEEITDLFNKFIKKIKTKIILVGHSFGGAVIVSLKNTRRIKGYVFVASLTPSLLNSRIHSSLITMANKNIPKTIMGKMATTHAKKFGYDAEFALSFITLTKGFETIRNECLINKNYIRNILSEKFQSVNKPIYSMIGAKDLVIPRKQYKEYFQNSFNVDTKLIPGAKHNPMKQQPDHVNDYLNSLFDFKKRKRKMTSM